MTSKKIALPIVFLVATWFISACTPRPEDGSMSDSVVTQTPDPGQLPGAKAPRMNPDRSRENYIVPMDSLGVTYEGTNAIVDLHGPLGDGCQRFEYMDSVRNNTTLELTFWASRPTAKDVMCTMIMQYIDRELRVPQDAYTSVSVRLPNGSFLSRSLSEQ